ncbi:fibronectin type III domain-containing protein [Streptomyces sp. NPDC048282]|uniref:fibronectin type III domain-containing protein n=1 Tax=Streptomyces sp. NPDC048282 TaxID=3365528 RepID=UPI0037160648
MWTERYYANTSFSGTPKKSVCDKAIDENYGSGGPPGVGLPRDKFGVRWTMNRDFGSGGPFVFTVAVRDGIRVYLDGQRKIDLWGDVAKTRTKSVNVNIPRGKHALRVDFAAFTGKADVEFAYQTRTSPDVDKVRPLAPTGVGGALVPGYRAIGVSVKWAKNVELDLGGYRLYRRPTGSSTWTLISGRKLITGHSYTDVPATDGSAFDYAVTAVDQAGNESSPGVVKGVASGDITPPTTPTGLTATGTDAGVELSWHPVPDAKYYEVVRVNPQLTEQVLVGTPKGTTITDTTVARDVDALYRVAAVDEAGNISAYSPDLTARRLVAAPGDVAATVSKSGAKVTLTWTVPADGGEYVGFNVYVSESLPVDLSAKHWGCASSVVWSKTADGRWQATCTMSTTGWTGTLYLALTGYDQYNDESLPSQPVTVTFPDS